MENGAEKDDLLAFFLSLIIENPLWAFISLSILWGLCHSYDINTFMLA
jgi:hypothetical protein